MIKLLVFFSVVILVACQSMDKRSSNPQKMVKDIPLSQNKDNQNIKKRLVVLPFIDNKKILTPEMSAAIKKAFIREINKNEDVISFDSEDLKMNSLRINSQGSYDFKDIQKLLKEYSVHSGLEAQIHDIKIKKSVPTKGVLKNVKVEYECSIIVKILNQSGKELFNTMKTVTYKDQGGDLATELMTDSSSKILATLIKDALFEFVPQVVKSLETIIWEGRVASIQGERIFLNVGKISGLNTGDLLRVVDEGEEIYDTESGQFIGKSPGRLKGTLEVVSFFGQDGAIAVIHSGGGFRENDRVELY
jgi:hypothetical protein